MNRETQLENRIFKIILWAAIIASGISIIGNNIFGFPLSINGKWIALILISSFSLRVIKKSEKYLQTLRLTFFLFVILILIPFGWIDSGGSNNNTIAYVFLLLICVVYFFKGKTRKILVLLLISVFTSLHCLEHFYPKIIKVYSSQSQFYDRLVQIPLTLGIGYFLVKQFADAYEKEKTILDQYSKELEYLATKDTLTGLYNRRSFDNELNRIIEKKTASQEVYLALFDIDDFKKINDNYGHVSGDKVLRYIAQMTENTIPVGNFIFRWGGDEFAILYKGSEEELKQHIHELKKEIANIDGHKTITISVGITEIHKGENMDEALKRADQALYISKENGRNQVKML